jgi:two-component system, sensor histidine kinase ChiS
MRWIPQGEKIVVRSYLHVVVCDTGIGIPEDKIEKVFDVFQQADGDLPYG